MAALGFIFVCAVLLGAPISFSILLACMGYFLTEGISMTVIGQQIVMLTGDSFTLMAVPFFIFAGGVMNHCGITDKIFGFCEKLVGHIPGGLGHANVLASIVFAGMSGSAVADTGGLGAIELKAMREAGYDDDFSLAVTGASSCIGPVIPPSVPFVMYGSLAGVSVGALFMGGFLPGILMGAVMMLFVYWQAKKRRYAVKKRASIGEIWKSFQESFFALLTPIILIGGIMLGVFTPTECAVAASFYALAYALISGRVRLREIPGIVAESLETTVMVMFIASTSAALGWILTNERVPATVANFMISAFQNKYAVLFAILVIFFLVGMFMDGTASCIILTPILAPVMASFGYSLVQFGVFMTVALMIGLLTPPVGMVLFVLSSISGVKVERIAKAIVPYIILLLMITIAVMLIPQISLLLPRIFGYPV